jgi:hypothetical protein
VRRSVKRGTRFLTVPYVFLAKGDMVPDAMDRIYIDERDL